MKFCGQNILPEGRSNHALPLTTREPSFSFLILPGSRLLDGLPRNHRNFKAEISVLSILLPSLDSKTKLSSRNKLQVENPTASN